MTVVKLRQVGGSLSFAVPPAIKESLGLLAGASLDVSAESGKLVGRPTRPRYTIEELVAQCDFDVPYSEEERARLDAVPVGREAL